MEPRPQQPRQPSGQRSQSTGHPPVNGSAQQPTTEHYRARQAAEPHQQVYPEGYDPAAIVPPPRTDYDYSPLDLAPPGQRRRRQLIAGAIGALSVVLLGALIVFGWILLREDGSVNDENRVAIATEAPSDNSVVAAADENIVGTPAATTEAPPTAPPPTEPAATDAVPPDPAGQVVATDQDSLIAALPDASTLPPGFGEGTDTARTQEEVVNALGGSRIAEQNLANWGWTANVERAFNNAAPEAGATSNITISLHGFKNAASAAEALPFYSDVLAANGYYDVEAPSLGANARMLQLDQEDGGVLVALYVQEGPILYRVGGYALGGDPTQDVINVATQMLAAE